MTVARVVERYVVEMLAVVNARARLECNVVLAVQQCARAAGHDDSMVAFAGEVAARVVRERMWAK